MSLKTTSGNQALTTTATAIYTLTLPVSTVALGWLKTASINARVDGCTLTHSD